MWGISGRLRRLCGTFLCRGKGEHGQRVRDVSQQKESLETMCKCMRRKSDMNGVKDLVMTGMRFDDGNFAALSRERWMHLLVFFTLHYDTPSPAIA